METCSSDSDKNINTNNNPGSTVENLVNSLPVQASLELEVVPPPQSPKKESPILQQAVDDDREDVKATKANPTMSGSENQGDEKFLIDLMAPPPPLRSSPERDVENNNLVADADKEVKAVMKEDRKSQRMNKEEAVVVEMEKVRAKGDGTESSYCAEIKRY
ncbi:Protein TIME FOR COFFEE [Sesbania bispinosa]|nr:Protein TIME FOR COFFEE [Sesbania bispinosa]